MHNFGRGMWRRVGDYERNQKFLLQKLYYEQYQHSIQKKSQKNIQQKSIHNISISTDVVEDTYINPINNSRNINVNSNIDDVNDVNSNTNDVNSNTNDVNSNTNDVNSNIDDVNIISNITLDKTFLEKKKKRKKKKQQ